MNFTQEQIDAMPYFEAQDCFFVKDRGVVISVINDRDRVRSNNGLTGNYVRIGKQIIYVRGVESFAIEPIRKGDPIGLLI